jgi:hypothetical protein
MTVAAIFGLLGIALFLTGMAGLWWSFVLQALAVCAFGLATTSLAISLRGPEEERWNALMLIGTLLAIGGAASIPIIAVWRLMT